MADSGPVLASAATAAPRTASGVQRTAHGCFWALIVLAALQAAWYRRTLNPDGVAYLDLSDAVLDGRWGDLVQAYWSPVYPVLLALARRVAGRDALHETLIAHGVNLAGFMFALRGWHMLLAQLARRRVGLVAFGTPLGMAAGYAVFAWAMLWLTSLHFVTPDLWLAGWIFAAAALVVRHDETVRAHLPLALGAALGAGYLTKSVLLPVAPFFIAGAVLLAPGAQRVRVALRAGAMLALVAGPWIAAISMHAKRPTFGDNGRFNYAWFVNGDRWLSPDPQRESGPGAAVFPRVVAAPATYAWPTAAGTYAPWRDPSSWHSEMTVRVDAARQMRVLTRSWSQLAFWMVPWGVLLTVMVLAGATVSRDAVRPGLALAVPSVGALAGYALVFVEGRYVAPFLALLAVAVVAALRRTQVPVRRLVLAAAAGTALWIALDIPIPGPMELLIGLLVYAGMVARGACPRQLTTVAGAAMIAIGGSHVVFRSVGEAAQLAAHTAMVDGALVVRTVLKTESFPEGRSIAVIGDGPSCAVWAREIRARIVAEVPASQAAAFWGAADEARSTVARAMRAAGAQEIIASGVLPATLPPGWHRASASVARYALDVP